MSQWTHVLATIRFDDIRFPGMEGKPPDLGKTCSFSDDRKVWDECDVPCGSEGSLQHSLWVNPNENHIAAYTATIWGDLRDYDDAEEIVEYLDRVIMGRIVRSGIAHIDVEGKAAVVLAVAGELGWMIVGEEANE